MDKQTFMSSAIWKIAEAFSTKGISLIISILLARILLPEDYGIITLTAVFISLSTILVQSGLSTALIRKEKVDDIDYNNGFIIGFCIALICYIVFFWNAPVIADFYNEQLLIPVLRVQMLSLFLVAFGNIQTVIITREFRFRELCIANIISNFISGLTGVVLAYTGFGVWSLVFYTLLRDGISSFVVFLKIKWHPKLKYDLSRMRLLLRFSIWVLVATVVDFIGNNYSSTMIGKKYSLSELGLYNKGNQIPEMICLYTFGAISSVLLPTLSVYQKDRERLKHVCRRLVEMSSYIIFPMMIGLGLIADKLVPFLFTDKWNASVPVFIFACISYSVNPLRVINMQLIYAIGDSKKGLSIEMIRSALLITGISLCVFVFKTSIYGISGVAAGVSVLNLSITQFYAKKYIEYDYREWIRDMLPALRLCAGMMFAVYIVGLLPLHTYFLMFIQIAAGVCVYLGLSIVTHNSSFYEVKTILNEKFSTRTQ